MNDSHEHNGNQRVKRRHRYKHDNFVKHVNEEGYSLPMEMRPVIDVIMQYGRKTNAIGNLGAAKILTDIANEIKRLGLDKGNHAISALVSNAEKQAENIRLNFETAYDERG